ncbi:MAG: DNA polymerase III subunit delta' [Cyanobacteria bacterium P01_H01_bin.121]
MTSVAISDPFAPLIGQPQAVKLLRQAVQQRQVAPAYLFVGPDGIGRRLAARCFAALLFTHETGRVPVKCVDTLHRRLAAGNHPDLFWIEPTYLVSGKQITRTEAIATGVTRKTPPIIRLGQIRALERALSRPPLEAARHLVVLDAAEAMQEAAANGLLKTLEEPGRATLILLVPSLESILPTLVSRCQRIPFVRLDPTAMATILQTTGHADILDHSEVMAMAQGSPGQTIQAWEHLQNLPEDLHPLLQTKVATPHQALTWARAIDRTLDLAAQLWLIDYLQQVFWQQCHQPDPSELMRQIQSLEHAKRLLQRSVQPRLVWEVTLLQLQTDVRLSVSGLTPV